MLCKEIMQVIEAAYPKSAALDFDNVGLLAGRAEKEVNVYIWRLTRQTRLSTARSWREPIC